MRNARVFSAMSLVIAATAVSFLARPRVAAADSTPAAPTADATAAPTGNASAAATPPRAEGAAPKPRSTFGVATQGPIEESTIVRGKPSVNLKGVWLLVAQAELVPGKFKSFPQIFQITEAKGEPKIHLLDVRLPPSAAESLKEATRKTLTPWAPSPEVLADLKQHWSTLPPATDKALDEFLYGKMTYTVAAPDQYAAAFPQQGEELKKVLDGSKAAIKIEEAYKPRDLGPDSRIAQMITRITTYGIKSVSHDTMNGTATMSMIAAGAGTPIPYVFNGPFTMYRLQ
jgi:hypothetical protein